MAKHTFMLVCSAGMSTSMLVKEMKEVANKKDLDVEIFAVSANETEDGLKNNNVDVLMIGPQLRYMKPKLEEKCSDKKIPVVIIDMQDYGMMNGKNVLETALEYI